MTLPRTKSAPHGMPALIPAPLVRAASFHTVEETMKDIKSEREEEAFNLSGFFPREKQWSWMGEAEGKEGVKAGSLFGASDRMIQEAIKGEDKLGVLSLGELVRRMGSWGDEDKQRRISGLVDETGAWLQYRQDWTGSLDANWKTPLDSAIDDYFPIWDIDGGNSRDTKLPHVG